MCIRALGRSRSRGQAMLEYVLLLLVIVVILGGVIYQFNDAFKNFSSALFVGEDSYLGCLIKEGVVPMPGQDAGECAWPQFSMSKGKQKAFAQEGGSDGSSGGSSGAGGAKSNANKNASNSHRNQDNAGNFVPLSRADHMTFKGASGSGPGGAAGAGGKKEAAYTGNTKTGGSTGGGFEEMQAREEYVRSGKGRFVPARKKEIGEVKTEEKSIPTNERDIKSARMIAAEKAKKQKLAEEDKFELSFGNIIKIILILALIFMIIFFVGSQFMAVARGSRRQK